MFTNVLKAVLKFLLVYLPILIGFSFGFFMLLPHNKVFDKSLTSTLTILTMMLGEFNFADNFTWDQSMAEVSIGSTQVSSFWFHKPEFRILLSHLSLFL